MQPKFRKRPLVVHRMLTASADDDWEWPDDNALSSPYYTSRPKAVPGEAPAPTPSPVKLPTRVCAAARPAQAPAVTLISDYAWCDDGPAISVYVTGLHGLRKDGVVAEFSDQAVSLRIQLPDRGLHVLELHKLFDRISAVASKCRVLEHKDKVILKLTKRVGREDADGVSYHVAWPRLHFGSSTAGAESIDIPRAPVSVAPPMPELPQLSAARR